MGLQGYQCHLPGWGLVWRSLSLSAGSYALARVSVSLLVTGTPDGALGAA